MLFSVSRALKGELFNKDEVALIEKFMRMAIVETQNMTSRKVRLKENMSHFHNQWYISISGEDQSVCLFTHLNNFDIQQLWDVNPEVVLETAALILQIASSLLS